MSQKAALFIDSDKSMLPIQYHAIIYTDGDAWSISPKGIAYWNSVRIEMFSSRKMLLKYCLHGIYTCSYKFSNDILD